MFKRTVLPFRPLFMALACFLLIACGQAEQGGNTDEAQAASPVVKENTKETAPMTEETSGAGSESANGSELIGSSWWVEDILAAGVVDRSRTTIAFTEDGRAAGSGGCNRFTGSYELDGNTISFGMMAGTMMACPEALMNQDRRFHEALGQTVSWTVDKAKGLLYLKNESGEVVIRASALPAGEEA